MRAIFSILLLLSFLNGQAQHAEDHWETYLAQYDDGVGSTTVNMSLRSKPPFQQHRYLLIAGVKFTQCKEGFPTESEFENIHAFSDSVQGLVNALPVNPVHAGSFMQNCERLEYVYVTDTAGLRRQLTTLFQNRFPGYQPSIKIRVDKDWSAYHEFLYPNEATLDYMANSEVVEQLSKAGDKLDQPRPIDHWLYFKTAADRQAFLVSLQKEPYTVTGKEKTDGVRPYQLHLTRVSKADLETICPITLSLKKAAEKYHGVYDGWESIVVK